VRGGGEEGQFDAALEIEEEKPELVRVVDEHQVGEGLGEEDALAAGHAAD
jgi:hypothetical protein